MIDRQPLPVIALLFIIGLKIFLLVEYAPYEPGQNRFTTGTADVILDGFGWLTDADEKTNPFPPTLWRPVSYGLVAAMTKILAGDHWVWLLLSIQSAIGVLAGLFVYRLGRVLRFSVGLSTIAFILYSLSIGLSNDLILLADGFVGSLGTICLCILAIGVVTRGLGHTRSVLAAGLFMMGAFLFRDSMLYPAVGLSILIMLAPLLSGERMSQGVLSGIVFIAPLLCSFIVIGSWNQYRTGHWVITTGGQHAYINTVVRIARFEPKIFQTGSLLDQYVLSAGLRHYGDPEAQIVNHKLSKEHGLSAIELQKIMKEKYLWVMRTYPDVFFKAYVLRLHPRHQEPVLGNPFRNIDELDSWTDSQSGIPYWTDTRKNIQRFYETRDLSHIDAKTALTFYPRIGFRLLNLGLLGVFIAILPLALITTIMRSHDAEKRQCWTAMGLLWAFYVGTVLVYAMVDVTPRYLGPAVVCAIVGSLFTLLTIWRSAFLSRTIRALPIIGR